MKVIDLQKTCGGYPTTFEWKNGKGKDIYFRLRHGHARIENETTNKIIIEGSFPYGDGVCSWEEAVRWARENGLKLKEIQTD